MIRQEDVVQIAVDSYKQGACDALSSLVEAWDALVALHPELDGKAIVAGALDEARRVLPGQVIVGDEVTL